MPTLSPSICPSSPSISLYIFLVLTVFYLSPFPPCFPLKICLFVTFPSLCCEFLYLLSFSTASVSLHFVFSFFLFLSFFFFLSLSLSLSFFLSSFFFLSQQQPLFFSLSLIFLPFFCLWISCHFRLCMRGNPLWLVYLPL